MKKVNLLPVLSAIMLGVAISPNATAQLVNDGAIIKVQPGAIIFVQGNFENKNSGAISNDGKIEVQGNFLNTATYNSATADDSLILSGAGNITFNSGASTLTNLWINKTAAGNRVTLTGTALLSGKLDYDQGLFTTDPILNPTYLFSAPTSAIFDFAAGKEIIGNVRRTGWANGSTIVFNQPNMQVATSAGTAPTDVTVTMIPLTESGDPTDNEREVKRRFNFAQTGGTGFSADVRMPYVSGELNTNTEANLVPWGRFTGVWNGKLTPVTRDAANDWVATTGIPQADFLNEWKLADPRYSFDLKIYLRGGWNNSAGNMNIALNTNNLIPLSQPYCLTCPAPVPVGVGYAGTESVLSIPTNVVDWVLVDFRRPDVINPVNALSATRAGQKAAFILNNGSIVETDGVTPLNMDISKQGAGFVVIRHRNHLAVMSNAVSPNPSEVYANNFSTSVSNSYKIPGRGPDPVTQMATSGLGATIFGMWAGDINRSGAVTVTDITQINSAIGGLASGNTNVYSTRDANLSKDVTVTDVTVTNFSIGQSAGTSTPGRGGNGLGVRKIISHVPGEKTNE